MNTEKILGQLTAEQKARYWAKAFRAVPDFYLGGERYHGEVQIRKDAQGTPEIWARPIGASRYENISVVMALIGATPTTAGGRQIYADIPESVSLRLYRERKALNRTINAV